MKKIIILTLALVIFFTGVAFAKITTEKNFDGTTTITSTYKLGKANTFLFFKTTATPNGSKPAHCGLGALASAPGVYASRNGYIKFNNDENHVYDLLYVGGTSRGVVFLLPDGAIAQISKATSISFHLFVWTGDGLTFPLPPEIVEEWKIVVATE
jgi:hypothetical protein